MISMLIYSCKQNEIELLREISKDYVADHFDEQLEIVVADARKEGILQKIDNMTLLLLILRMNRDCGWQKR